MGDGSRSRDYVDAGFDAGSFDHTAPHTARDWRNYFFAVNPECEIADAFPNRVIRTQLHLGAVRSYLEKKIAAGLVTDMATDPVGAWLSVVSLETPKERAARRRRK